MGLKATLRRFIELKRPGSIRGSHKVNLLKQTCRWCRTLAWDREPPHHFIPFVEATERPASQGYRAANFEEVTAQRGCKRYDEAKAVVAEQLQATKLRAHYVYYLTLTLTRMRGCNKAPTIPSRRARALGLRAALAPCSTPQLHVIGRPWYVHTSSCSGTIARFPDRLEG